MHIGVDDETAGLDLFVGEPEYVGKGLGPTIIRKFLRDVVFGSAAATSCVIGPEEANRSAIRAYEKVGFRYWKRVLIPGESKPEYLMRITPADLSPAKEEPSVEEGAHTGDRRLIRHRP